jgi:site-specific DNA recombinase
LWYRSNWSRYICGIYARYVKKTCAAHTIKLVIKRIEKQIDVQKNRKRKYINLFAELITHEEYQDSIEANNKELAELIEEKMNFLHF